MLLKLNPYLIKVSIFLITAALIAGIAGCDYNPPPSKDLEIRTWYDLDVVRDNLAGNHTLMNDLDSTTAGYTELASPTANGGKGWQPIGFYTPHGPTCCEGFAGTFDGQGYEIRDLFIDRPDEDGVGLFKHVERYYGIIKNIGVTNVTVIGRNGVGGLVGGNGGTVSNCYCSGEVTGNGSIGGLAGSGNGVVIDSCFTGSVTGYEYVGGLVGNNHCDVSRSHFAGNVTGSSYVGGLVGENGYATVSDSYCSGSVTGYEHVGGLVGYIFRSTVSNSYSTASVTGNEGVGGLVGDSYEFDVGNSYYDYDDVLINGENIITIGALFGEDFDQWLANDKFLDVDERLSQENGYYLINDVTDFKQLLAFGQDSSLKFRLKNDLDFATEPNFYIPYLAGEFDGNGHKISNLSFNFDFVCYVGLFGYLAPGGEVSQVGVENINITGAGSVGGLVGQSRGNVSNCYSTGSVTGKEWYVGGLIGRNYYGTVSDSYSTGSATGNHRVGGLVGWNHDSVSNSFWDIETSGLDDSDGGTGKTTAEMQDIATFSDAGWNIVAVALNETNPAYIWNIVNNMTYPFLSWQT
jgi:hypothetical protein